MYSTNDVDRSERKMNIQVVVRCRERIEHEINVNSPVIVKTTPYEILTEQLPEEKLPKTYTFDRVFGPEEGQARIFDYIVVPMLHGVEAGYSCTLLAYGQTSTGKTYTMEGDLTTDGEHAGIIPRTLSKLFQDLEETEVQDFLVKVSYVELYNEDLKDLLSSDDDQRELKILDEGINEGKLIDIEEVIIENATDGIRILKQGSIKRHTVQTNYNKNSSQSNSVFSITVHIKNTMSDGEDLLKVGKFNLVDLVGSDCISRQEKDEDNISILTLNHCVNALNEHSSHIPFRESQLTRLLQDSLGGKTKTCIIATISPAELSYEETISTLDFAHQAKYIYNEPVANHSITKRPLIKENVGEISEIESLKMDLQAAQGKQDCNISQQSYQLLVDENQYQLLVDENQSRKNEIGKLKNENEKLQREKLRENEMYQVCEMFQRENERFQRANELWQRVYEELQRESEKLQRENVKFQIENEKFQRVNEKFQIENEKFQREIERFQRENDRIQREKNEEIQRENEKIQIENEKRESEKLQGEKKLQKENEKIQRENVLLLGGSMLASFQNNLLSLNIMYFADLPDFLKVLHILIIACFFLSFAKFKFDKKLQRENEELQRKNEELREDSIIAIFQSVTLILNMLFAVLPIYLIIFHILFVALGFTLSIVVVKATSEMKKNEI